MAIKINKINIQNFKVFSSRTFDFDNSEMIVLDGPNGFGKTSFYDAVELLITGEIRRYIRLGEEVIDKKRKDYSNENPYLHRDSPSGDIIIEGVFYVNGIEKTIRRKALNKDIGNTHTFDCFKLSVKSDSGVFENYGKEDEQNCLSKLFGKNYRQNFRFLNYIEQEDSTFLLKNKEKEKKSQIAHLFNAEEFQTKLELLKAVKTKMAKLCTPVANKEIQGEKTKLVELKKKVSQKEEIAYDKLFKELDFYWDNVEIEFPIGIYNELLGDNGIITRLKSLLEHKEEYKNYKRNLVIDNLLSKKEDIEKLIRYFNFLEQKEELNSQKTTLVGINKLISSLEKISLEDISNKKIVISDTIKKNVLKSATVEQYNTELKSIVVKLSKATELESILTSLKESRDTLSNKFVEFQEKGANQKNCPLCGYEWKDAKLLASNIDNQTTKIDSLLNQESKDLSILLSEFKKNQIKFIVDELKAYQKTIILDGLFIDNLQKVDSISLKNIKGKIERFGIVISEYLSAVPKLDEVVRIEDLIKAILAEKKEFDLTKIEDHFNDTYIKFFKDESINFEDYTVQSINDKIAYIEWKYSLNQNNAVSELQNAISVKENQYKKATELKKQLNSLEKIYKKSLEDYNKQLIRDIEILFHIYSGRIVQDFQGGLGLFIDNKNGIKFLTDPSRSYDAIFSMSSGQLSALIISFTLALNKKYSQNKVLLIDDPVQTMDELNIAGFIDLLRNEFSDRQIFISTHEEVMSSYMRYKFEKYDHKTLRMNVKESVN